jgi:hypothetical protein
MGRLTTYFNIEQSKMTYEARNLKYTESMDDKGRIQLRAKLEEEDPRIRVRR